MSAVIKGTIRNEDGTHEDTIWTCESRSSHKFIQKWGERSVTTRYTRLGVEQVKLLAEKGLCPLCG
jgi:hypothetical protein